MQYINARARAHTCVCVCVCVCVCLCVKEEPMLKIWYVFTYISKKSPGTWIDQWKCCDKTFTLTMYLCGRNIFVRMTFYRPLLTSDASVDLIFANQIQQFPHWRYRFLGLALIGRWESADNYLWSQGQCRFHLMVGWGFISWVVRTLPICTCREGKHGLSALVRCRHSLIQSTL